MAPTSAADRFAAHALDLFALLGPGVVSRRMFGGLGFYARGLFFAVGDQDEGRVFLKVDDLTRPTFEAAGGRPFTYTVPGQATMTMAYLTPPDGALEDPEEMLPWARLALEAAGRAAAAKAAKAAGPKAKATPAKTAKPSKPKATPKAAARAKPAKPAAERARPAPRATPRAKAKAPATSVAKARR